MSDLDRSRRWAMRGLYAWETRGAPRGAEIRILHEAHEGRKIDGVERMYAEALARLVTVNLQTLDATISELLENWSLERLSRIDRMILRLGAAELLYMDDTDPAEVVRSAMRLAEAYGTDESPRFINGVIEAIRRRIAAA